MEHIYDVLFAKSKGNGKHKACMETNKTWVNGVTSGGDGLKPDSTRYVNLSTAIAVFAAMCCVTVLVAILTGLIVASVKDNSMASNPASGKLCGGAESDSTTSAPTTTTRAPTTAARVPTTGARAPTTSARATDKPKPPPKTETPPCTNGEICVDLDQTGTTTGYMDGLTTRYSISTPQGTIPCSRRGVFRVEFEKLSDDPSLLCYNGPYKGRRMLKIQVTLSSGSRSGHILDFGDSISNNGYAGDAYDSDYAAELHGVGTGMAVWGNIPLNEPNGCTAQQLYNFPGSLNASVSEMTVWIANNFIKVTNDNGLNAAHCSKCLYGLNGQKDGRAGGTADQYIWIALNRVVWGSRSGYGICSVRMKWVENADSP